MLEKPTIGKPSKVLNRNLRPAEEILGFVISFLELMQSDPAVQDLDTVGNPNSCPSTEIS
jgi:hypothetical protein